MVLPSTPSSPPSSQPERSIVLLAVKILLVATILFLLPELVQAHKRPTKKRNRKNRRLERAYHEKLLECETGPACGEMILEESMNCVTKCVSPSCHGKERFDVDPLEDGEVDEERAGLFALCVRLEMEEEIKTYRAAASAARGQR